MRHVNICIVGCGGTGGNLIGSLARFLSAYRENVSIAVAIVDADRVEEKNVGRQPYTIADIGECKAVRLAQNLYDQLQVHFYAFDQYITEVHQLNHIFGALRGYNGNSTSNKDIDILISCVDNHAARYVFSQWFKANGSLPMRFYIDSANEDMAGEVVFAIKHGNVIVCPDRFHYFPNMMDDLGKHVTEMSCEELSTVAPQHYATNKDAANICFSYLSLLLMNVDAAERMKGGITYFHTFQMFRRFDAYQYDEVSRTYVKEA